MALQTFLHLKQVSQKKSEDFLESGRVLVGFLVVSSLNKFTRQIPTTLLKQDLDMDVFLENLQYFSKQLFCKASAKDCLWSLETLLVFNRKILQCNLSELATVIRNLKEQPLRKLFFREATSSTASLIWLFYSC